MTSERRQDVLLIALGLSVAMHLGMMFYARSQVMTRIARGKTAAERLTPMQVVKAAPMAEAAKIEELMDLKAVKAAPEAERVKVEDPQSEAVVPAAERLAPVAPAAELSDPRPQPAAFEIKVADAPVAKRQSVPVMTIDTPLALVTASAVMPTVERVTVKPMSGPKLAVGVAGPVMGKVPTRMGPSAAEKPHPAFKPSTAVYEKVDERIVADEKAAVRQLLNQERSEELAKFVKVALVRETQRGWTYFKLRITPLATLAPVPKDVVVIIDASGSIGGDRMVSIRKAAKRILRSATNSDDRFNLVAFRDRFSYAFRNWQECTQQAFDQSDKWLNNLAAHGRTDVFGTIASVLTLPRDPRRPLIALVVTDGDANSGVSDNAAILRQFTALNGGLVSVYMYGVKSSANRELIDVLTHGNRGESFVFEGWRWNAGEGIESLSERFRDPVLSDLTLMFAVECGAEAYPHYLRNLYRGETLELCGRVRSSVPTVAFSLRGLNGAAAYDGYFRLPLAAAPVGDGIAADWQRERVIDLKLQ